jgi:hypothetical protein
MLTDRQLDSVKLTEKQIYVLMKLFKRLHQKRPFLAEETRRLGTNVRALQKLEKLGFARDVKSFGGWKITANGLQLAHTYDVSLADL